MTSSDPSRSSRAGVRPRFTIERLRALVLAGGAILVAAIGFFLYSGHLTRRFLGKDIPQALGLDIESRSDGVDYTETRKGKTLFKLHADRAEQMKRGDKGGHQMLHGVTIHLYGNDGNESDTISGSEFEYDPAAGVAQARGAVAIALMRPGEKPAIAELKPGRPAASRGETGAGKAAVNSTVHSALLPIAGQITDSEIHVLTSGLSFNQKSGVATTAERVDFALRQGSGSSVGAMYDSGNGLLVLNSAVVLHILRGPPKGASASGGSGPVTVHATHAEMLRAGAQCTLTQAQAEYTGGAARMADARLHFRPDGSVIRLDGSGGVELRTQAGAEVTAPQGSLEFDPRNRPVQGELAGGAQLISTQPTRQMRGSSPSAHLQFDGEGQLRQAHLERGVEFASRQQTTTAKGLPAEVRRSWKSQTADLEFAPAAKAAAGASSSQPKAKSGQGSIEIRTIHGFGGAVVTSETEIRSASGVQITPSRLAADTLVAQLAPGAVLSTLSGFGHASFQERNPAGVNQTTASDQLEVRFNPPPAGDAPRPKSRPAPNASHGPADADTSQIASVVQMGHVTMTQDAPAAPSVQAAQSARGSGTQEIRAEAGRADYDGKTQLLHLSGLPRIHDGALDLTANTIDFARNTGDAAAHGDVRASWANASGSSNSLGAAPGGSLLAGGNSASGGPAHAIAEEAELHQATQEVVFRAASSAAERPAGNARLWQGGNSVAAPLIVLNRAKQTLDARSNGPANAVFTVLIGNSRGKTGVRRPNSGQVSGGASGANPSANGTPSVIRVRSGELHYSEGERLALFHPGALGQVREETTQPDGIATVVSQQAEVHLLPAGGRGPGAANGAGGGEGGIDRLTAWGRVNVQWPDRKGTGEKLVYLSDDGAFTLTGTAAAPPRITDPVRGSVTGSALIFHTRDDSVTVEGDGGKTATETQSPK